jgi:hypothetical protein
MSSLSARASGIVVVDDSDGAVLQTVRPGNPRERATNDRTTNHHTGAEWLGPAHAAMGGQRRGRVGFRVRRVMDLLDEHPTRRGHRTGATDAVDLSTCTADESAVPTRSAASAGPHYVSTPARNRAAVVADGVPCGSTACRTSDMGGYGSGRAAYAEIGCSVPTAAQAHRRGSRHPGPPGLAVADLRSDKERLAIPTPRCDPVRDRRRPSDENDRPRSTSRPSTAR